MVTDSQAGLRHLLQRRVQQIRSFWHGLGLRHDIPLPKPAAEVHGIAAFPKSCTSFADPPAFAAPCFTPALSRYDPANIE